MCLPALALAFFSFLNAPEPTEVATASAPTEESSSMASPDPIASADVKQISQAFGHLIGKNLQSIGYTFDVAQVIKGLQDAAEGKESPMTEAECVKAITAAQETVFKQQAEVNLKKADEFLAKNSATDGVVSLQEGKLQYRVEKAGTGEEVREHAAPLIRYTGQLLDGTIFGTSKEEESISLDETIPGFSQGLLGMREGEKRTLYIHPDLGYGMHGYLPPNSLLTFEIEVVKAGGTLADELSPDLPKSHNNPEIAQPLDDVRALR